MEEFEYSFKEYEPERKKRKPARGLIALALVACMALCAVCGYAGASIANRRENNSRISAGVTTTTRASALSVKKPAALSAADKSLTVAQIAEMCADSVVEVTTESIVTGRFMGQYIATGAGSGVIFSDDGYIVTCYHVVEGASSVRVMLRSGKEYEARIISYDEQTDIAILKIDAAGLSYALFGDSDGLIVGEPVVAIGNPLGELGGTVTDGIISALSREISVQDQKMTLLQTNAAINPGNSGGGLFDAAGRLIGVVNAKSYGEEIEGLGFAIPSNTALNVINELLDHGYVRGRIDLGLELIDVTTSRQAFYYGLDSTGVYVFSVSERTSGVLRAGDRIVSINGTEITSGAQIEELKSGASVGDVWKVELFRSGKRMSVELKLEEHIPKN